MSIRIMDEVWELPYINTGELALLLAIAKHCDDEGVCWPSGERLRKMCKWGSKSTYTRYIKILQYVGLIKKTARADTLEGRQTDLITLDCSKVQRTELLPRLRDARKKFAHKKPISTPPCTDSKINDLTPDKYTRVYPNHKPSQEEKIGNSSFNLSAEAISIANELDKAIQ
jgi:hypothetical protein